MGDLELSASDFIEIPSLYWKAVVTNGFQACVPGMVNLLVDGATLVLAKPFGPRDGFGDVFEQDVQTNLGGFSLRLLGDWNRYQVKLGEVHCGTNAKRTPPSNVEWWEETRITKGTHDEREQAFRCHCAGGTLPDRR
jgi:protein-arginine deiminase